MNEYTPLRLLVLAASFAFLALALLLMLGDAPEAPHDITPQTTCCVVVFNGGQP